MPRATTPTLLLALALALAAALPRAALAARTFAVANDRFEKDGEPFTIFSGSFHYHRALASTWPDRLSRIAAMGLNTIQTYVPWNFHELTRRYGDNATFDFTGDRDLGAFIDAAAAAGLLVLLRSGPYICGEHDLGGLPPFLLDTPGIASDADLRTNNSVYLGFVDRWYAQLLPVLKPRLYSNGGNIVLVQIENECECAQAPRARSCLARKQPRNRATRAAPPLPPTPRTHTQTAPTATRAATRTTSPTWSTCATSCARASVAATRSRCTRRTAATSATSRTAPCRTSLRRATAAAAIRATTSSRPRTSSTRPARARTRTASTTRAG